MASFIGLSGSLRGGSFNTALLKAAAELMPAGQTLEVRTMHGIPLYDGDAEAEHGIPAAVRMLQDAIAASDGLVIATPEYNHSVPGVLKNTIDWLTRPPEQIDRVFRGKPLALIGATPGGFGTILAQNAWQPILHKLGVRLWSEGRLLVSQAHTRIDDQGNVADNKTRDQLAQFVQGFIAHASLRSPA